MKTVNRWSIFLERDRRAKYWCPQLRVIAGDSKQALDPRCNIGSRETELLEEFGRTRRSAKVL